jgi:hypothetical protein
LTAAAIRIVSPTSASDTFKASRVSSGISKLTVHISQTFFSSLLAVATRHAVSEVSLAQPITIVEQGCGFVFPTLAEKQINWLNTYYPHPSSPGKTLSYLTLLRGSVIISATVSRQPASQGVSLLARFTSAIQPPKVPATIARITLASYEAHRQNAQWTWARAAVRPDWADLIVFFFPWLMATLADRFCPPPVITGGWFDVAIGVVAHQTIPTSF